MSCDVRTVVLPAPVIGAVVQPAQEVQVSTAGAQGPAGPPGPAGGAIVAPAGTLIHGHTALAVAQDGTLVPASADVLEHATTCVGVTEQAAVAGDIITAYSADSIEYPGWAWADGPVLLGLNGALTQTLPSGAKFALRIGWGSGTHLAVRVGGPIFTGV